MACKFSCFLSFTDAFKENDVGVFNAENGDVYRVTYKSNVCRDLLLKIEWTIPKTILLTVKLYNTTYKRCFSSKGNVVNGRNIFMKMRGAFNVSNSRNYKVLCVINLIPYIKFNDCNEIPMESLDDSGFVESDFQQSSTDENNDIIYENTKRVKENDEENSDVRNNAISVLDDQEISEQIEVKEHQELSSGESNFESDEITLARNGMRKDSVTTTSENISSCKINSEMSVLLINKDSLNSNDHCDKTFKNVCESFESEEFCKSLQNVENKEKVLENKFVENSKPILIGNSEKQTDEFVPSNGASHNINANVKSKPQDGFLITKLLTLDDYSQEIIEDFNTINISENSESNDYISENNSPMEIDLTEMSSEDRSASHDKENILGNSVPKVNKDASSDNMPSEIYQEDKTECLELSDNKNSGCSHDAIKPVMNSESMEADFILESNDVSMQNNESEEKGVVGLSNFNTSIDAEDTDPSKIKERNVDPPIKKSKRPTIKKQKPPGVKNAKINNTTTDNNKSKSPQLPSSKTGLVFQTLVRKLSVAEFDRDSTDVNGVASSSDQNIKNPVESETDNTIFPIMESELKGLSMDMLDLLTSGDMADASITNGEKHIKVHRAIVSARSSILKRLFTKHKEDEVEYQAVVEIPSDILEDVIIFLYVGLVYIKSTKMAQDLYQVAERYGINDLLDICSKHIPK